MASKTAAFPVISLMLDASGITRGLAVAQSALKTGMDRLASAVKTPFVGVALANQAAEFSAKLTRLFGEPFRQLMSREDMASQFSLVAGGADVAAKGLEGLRRVSRETGVSIEEMSTGLQSLLQGGFSFEGARQQIIDLTGAATVLGQGSLPMLAQAAAKFRGSAFAGFEDVNAIAAQGIPIYEALAQRLGVGADEARRLVREGMVTGLEARGALNEAANGAVIQPNIKPIQDARQQIEQLFQNPIKVNLDGQDAANAGNKIGRNIGQVLGDLNAKGFPVFRALSEQLGVSAQKAEDLARRGFIPAAKAAEALGKMQAGAVGPLQAQEQTLSGSVSRLREGLNQTLAEIGAAVNRVLDVPSLLARFRGFIDGVRAVIEAGLGPLKGVIGADGGGLKEKFKAAQEFSITALQAISAGFFEFLRGLEGIVNGFRSVVEFMSSWFTQKFTKDQEKMIADWQEANKRFIQAPQLQGGAGGVPRGGLIQVIGNRDAAIDALQAQGKLPRLGDPIDFKIGAMEAKVNDALAKARENLKKQGEAAAKAAEGQAAELNRQAEEQLQATDNLRQFTDTFKASMKVPVEVAQKQAEQLNTLITQAANKGAKLTQQQIADNEIAQAAIGRGLMDMLAQQTSMLNQARESVAYMPGSQDLIASITRAQNRETTDPAANIQERVARLAQAQLDEQRRQNEIGKNIFGALVALNQKPVAINPVAALR
jgi:hypothetical protein